MRDLDSALGERDPQLRWVPTAQWHVTLVFCGDVDEGAVPELTERLERGAARTPAMSLAIGGGGTFPRQAARARVLWMGLRGDVPAITRLAERCTAAARRTGIGVEDRPFRPHLTLARARGAGADVRDRVAGLSTYNGPSWPLTSITLVHSTLGATTQHTPLASFALASERHQA